MSEGAHMSQPSYVQHISGQGEKWEVCSDDDQRWHTFSQDTKRSLYLPKSEYRECPPPERWVDVTGDCQCIDNQRGIYRQSLAGSATIGDWAGSLVPSGYRLRKVEWTDHHYAHHWAFIVEKREP